MANETTLISLVSKQTWPQILSVLHLRPKKLLLLHSENEQESKMPAERLSTFFRDQKIIGRDSICLASVPHDDFSAVGRKLDDIMAEYNVSPDSCILNFTGGNKLMASASFDWARKKGVNAFYLERGNEMTWFEKAAGGMSTRRETLPGNIADDFDPRDILKCQIDASDIERKGEMLTLLRALDDTDLKILNNGGDPLQFLKIEGTADAEEKRGDRLELLSAVFLLHLGVKKVRRSLRLKAKLFNSRLPRPHTEIDLLFIWNDKMWIVDCKDKIASEGLVAALRRDLKCLELNLTGQVETLLERIAGELASKRNTVLKEDMAAIREIGGLLGRTICVRMEQMPDEVLQYAKFNNINVVQKNALHNSLKILLNPNAPAEGKDLAELENIFNNNK